MNSLKGKTAVITGGAGNIGFSILQKLDEAEVDVVVLSSTKDKGQETINRLGRDKSRCISFGCDVTNPELVKETFQKMEEVYGGIDYLICLQGVPPTGQQISEIAEEDWNRVLSTHVTGNFQMMQKAVPYLEKSSSGRIVFMSSAGARTGSTGEGLAYSTAKGAITSMTYCAANFLKDKGITVNCISPEGIGNDNKELNEDEKRVLKELAETVLCLLGDQAKYITGEVINV